MSRHEWFIDFGNGVLGPFTAAKLRELARAGRVKPATQVRTAIMDDYVPAGEVKGLFAADAPVDAGLDDPPTAKVTAGSPADDGLVPPASHVRAATARASRLKAGPAAE